MSEGKRERDERGKERERERGRGRERERERERTHLPKRDADPYLGGRRAGYFMEPAWPRSGWRMARFMVPVEGAVKGPEYGAIAASKDMDALVSSHLSDKAG